MFQTFPVVGTDATENRPTSEKLEHFASRKKLAGYKGNRIKRSSTQHFMKIILASLFALALFGRSLAGAAGHTAMEARSGLTR